MHYFFNTSMADGQSGGNTDDATHSAAAAAISNQDIHSDYRFSPFSLENMNSWDLASTPATAPNGQSTQQRSNIPREIRFGSMASVGMSTDSATSSCQFPHGVESSLWTTADFLASDQSSYHATTGATAEYSSNQQTPLVIDGTDCNGVMRSDACYDPPEDPQDVTAMFKLKLQKLLRGTTDEKSSQSATCPLAPDDHDLVHPQSRSCGSGSLSNDDTAAVLYQSRNVSDSAPLTSEWTWDTSAPMFHPSSYPPTALSDPSVIFQGPVRSTSSVLSSTRTRSRISPSGLIKLPTSQMSSPFAVRTLAVSGSLETQQASGSSTSLSLALTPICPQWTPFPVQPSFVPNFVRWFGRDIVIGGSSRRLLCISDFRSPWPHMSQVHLASTCIGESSSWLHLEKIGESELLGVSQDGIHTASFIGAVAGPYPVSSRCVKCPEGPGGGDRVSAAACGSSPLHWVVGTHQGFIHWMDVATEKVSHTVDISTVTPFHCAAGRVPIPTQLLDSPTCGITRNCSFPQSRRAFEQHHGADYSRKPVTFGTARGKVIIVDDRTSSYVTSLELFDGPTLSLSQWDWDILALGAGFPNHVPSDVVLNGPTDFCPIWWDNRPNKTWQSQVSLIDIRMLRVVSQSDSPINAKFDTPVLSFSPNRSTELSALQLLQIRPHPLLSHTWIGLHRNGSLISFEVSNSGRLRVLSNVVCPLLSQSCGPVQPTCFDISQGEAPDPTAVIIDSQGQILCAPLRASSDEQYKHTPTAPESPGSPIKHPSASSGVYFRNLNDGVSSVLDNGVQEIDAAVESDVAGSEEAESAVIYDSNPSSPAAISTGLRDPWAQAGTCPIPSMPRQQPGGGVYGTDVYYNYSAKEGVATQRIRWVFLHVLSAFHIRKLDLSSIDIEAFKRQRPSCQYRLLNTTVALEAIAWVRHAAALSGEREVDFDPISQAALQTDIMTVGYRTAGIFSSDPWVFGTNRRKVKKFGEVLPKSSDLGSPFATKVSTGDLKKLVYRPDASLALFNKAGPCGIEPSCSCSMVNAVIQVLRFVPKLQTYLVRHHCEKQSCLACELGLLWHMLALARKENKGKPCQAKNFLLAFAVIPEVRLCRILPDPHDTSAEPELQSSVQVFLGFILQHLRRELSNDSKDSLENCGWDNFPALNKPGSSLSEAVLKRAGTLSGENIVEYLFGCQTQTTATCINEKHASTSLPVTSFIIDLCPSSENGSVEKKRKPQFFATSLERSLQRKFTRSAYCKGCNNTTKLLHQQYAAGGAGVDVILEGADAFTSEWKRYELMATIFVVKDEIKQRPDCSSHLVPDHLVTHIRVPKKELLVQDGVNTTSPTWQVDNADKQGKATRGLHEEETAWIAMNDFVVTMADEKDVFDTISTWKHISCLFYVCREDLTMSVSTSHEFRCPIPRSILLRNTNLSRHPAAPYEPNFVPLSDIEVQQIVDHGRLLSLDAEFVKSRDETDLKEDCLSLARLSVIRGEGALEGVPCLDGYILTKEEPLDYLTQFSGLRPGDLDPNHSKHWLTTRKAMYQRLRFLLDHQCTFIGHGLSKDFSIINLFVPERQLLDTAELFRLPGRRFLSLKFLANHVLNKNVQTSALGHDSIEDATVALELYKKYLELYKNGSLSSVLQNLYNIGVQTNWQPVLPEGGPINPTEYNSSPSEGEGGGRTSGAGATDTPLNLDIFRIFS